MILISLYIFLGMLLTLSLDRIGNITLRWYMPWTEWVVAALGIFLWPGAVPYYLSFSNPNDGWKIILVLCQWLLSVVLFVLAVVT